MITGVGTGGHITAFAEVLKPRWPHLKVYAVEPTLSPVLSGGTHCPHTIQGIGAGFIPGVMRVDLLDGVIQVDPGRRRVRPARGPRGGDPDGRLVRRLARGGRPEGSRAQDGARVLTFTYDTGERYLSIEGLFG